MFKIWIRESGKNILLLFWHFCSLKGNPFRAILLEDILIHFCEIILVLLCNKYFYFSSDGHFVRQSNIVSVSWLEGNSRNIVVQQF